MIVRDFAKVWETVHVMLSSCKVNFHTFASMPKIAGRELHKYIYCSAHGLDVSFSTLLTANSFGTDFKLIGSPSLDSTESVKPEKCTSFARLLYKWPLLHKVDGLPQSFSHPFQSASGDRMLLYLLKYIKSN